MKEPAWLTHARTYLGTAEIPGKQNNPTIIRWLKELKSWWLEDETAWCGTYVAAVLRESGLPVAKHWYRAKDWLNWGLVLAQPTYGAIAVFERKGGGHVGFVVGKDKLGNILVLGGNQGDAVNIKAFPAYRVAGYRWPKEVPLPVSYQLAVGAGEISTTEA